MLSLLSASVLRLLRRLLLKRVEKMDVDRLLARAQRAAAGVAVHAARCSAAYRILLQEQQIDSSLLGVETPMSTLPILTKKNTFERFTLAQLASPMAPGDIASVLTSSGRGGHSFGFRLASRAQHHNAWFDIDLGLQKMFDVDARTTLLVNCLPMGVVFESRAVAVANVSVREDMACAILRDVGPRFSQTLVCADPLFIRRLLDCASEAGIDWQALNTSLILGEEMLVEAQRDYLAARMSIDLDGDSHRLIGSSFGVGELGLNLLFETRETIRLRRAMRQQTERHSAPSFFCFNPIQCHIEVLQPDSDGFGELCFTLLNRNAGILLPRYCTGDLGKVFTRAEATTAARRVGVGLPGLPLVAVKGRLQDRPSGMPTVESIKELIYTDHQVADQLTGAFRITPVDGGGIRLTMQLNSERALENHAVQERLKALIHSQQLGPIELKLLAPQAFPYRPTLDFERKFPYVARA